MPLQAHLALDNSNVRATRNTLLESSKHPDRVERPRLQQERPFRRRAMWTRIAITAMLAILGANTPLAGLADDENRTPAKAETASAARAWLLRPRWWRQPPVAPEPPLLTEASDDRLTVTWNAPEGLVFEIVDYDVQYRTTDSDTFLEWEHAGTATEATIVGLVESTAYEVRVRAAHELAAGDWSPPVVAATIEATPRFAEGESAVREIAENTPAGSDIGLPFHASAGARALRYGLEGPDADAFAIDPDSGQLRTRAGVSYDHESRDRHVLTVTASDPRGRSGRIAVTVLIADVDEVPGAPGAPEPVSELSTQITIGWTEHENTGPPIEGYDVQYRAFGGEFTEVELQGTTTTARVTGLQRATRYQFRVRAHQRRRRRRLVRARPRDVRRAGRVAVAVVVAAEPLRHLRHLRRHRRGRTRNRYSSGPCTFPCPRTWRR